MTDKKLCWLALGSNLPYGDIGPMQVIEDAIIALQDAGLDQANVSGFYRTEPVPKSDQPDFINCAVTGKISHKALKMLDICQSVEQSFGRDRSTRWGARTLDIDIINYDNQTYPSIEVWRAVAENMDANTEMPKLVLPHPFMHQRAFVLKPLCDLAPGWRHPVYSRTAADLLSQQPEQDRASVVAV